MPEKKKTYIVKAAHGGRPPRARAAGIREHILNSAAEVFFTSGYGAASIETIARQAGISKRTFYARFSDKADLFRAVIHYIVARLRPADTKTLFTGKNCEDNLHRLAQLMVHAAVSPQGLALHQLIIAEAKRFPELAIMAQEQGARQEAIKLIADMLKGEISAERMQLDDPAFAAEQFLQMVMASPQRRAMGLGKPMATHELNQWADKSVKLFLDGCHPKKSR